MMWSFPPIIVVKHALLREEDFDEQFEMAIGKLENAIDEFTAVSSGLTIEWIEKLDVSIAKYNPLSGGCNITIPPRIKKLKSVVNVVFRKKEKSEECFLYCILYCLYTQAQPNNI